MMSCTTFSQTLKPTLIKIETDTNFCFTIPQSKVIATHLIKADFADSLEISFEKQKSLFHMQLEKEQEIKFKLNEMIENLHQVILYKDESIDLLQADIKAKEKKIKRAKWHKILLGAASVISSAAVFIK